MDYVKEDTLFGNKSIIVGDNLHNLVLENLGKIYLRYGGGYKEFNSIISSLSSSSSSGKIIIESNGIEKTSSYEDGYIVYDAKAGILYLAYDNELLVLAESVTTDSHKYVRKTGDTMTGQLTIKTGEAPLIVKSSDLVENFNAQYLNGYEAKEFARKAADETISGYWTFDGNNTFNGENVFNDQTNFNETAVFNKSGSAAIRVGTGAIITDGSLGSSQFASGYTGYGWRLDANTNTLEIDNLIVRGILQVYELVVNKISATNGSMWITDSFKIKTIHNLEYLNCNDSSFNFNVNTYYIPYLYQNDDIFFTPDSKWDDIKEFTANTNLYRVRLQNQYYPLADRLSKNVDKNMEFVKFNYLFQIVDIDKFKSVFEGKTTTIWEHYTENFPDYGYYIDKNNYLRVADLGGKKAASDEKYNIQTDIAAENGDYLIVEEQETSGTYKLSKIEIDKTTNSYLLERATIQDINKPYTLGVQTYTYSQLASVKIINNLAAEGIVEKTNLYQKNTTKASQDEQWEYSLGDTIIRKTFTPIDPDFDKQIFTIATDGLILKDGKYVFPESSLARVNLYYKYFGEAGTIAGNTVKCNNIYILESDSDEYPVFKPGDILRCQKFTGNTVKQYHGIVLALVGAYGFVIQLQNSNILNTKTDYSYNENGQLIDSSTAIDQNLYNRSQGIDKTLRNGSSIERTTYHQDPTYLETRTIESGTYQIIYTYNENNQVVKIQETDGLNYTEKTYSNGELTNTIASTLDHVTQFTSLSSDDEGVTEDEEAINAVTTATAGFPQKDDALVRIGSIIPGDRRNSMYLTSSEDYSPYQDILVDVNRPDYTVVYFTPKYKTFNALTLVDDNYKYKKYYIQSDHFGEVMQLGDKDIAALNNIFTKGDVDIEGLSYTYLSEIPDTQFTSLTTDEISLYKKYRNYSSLSDLGSEVFTNLTEESDYELYIKYRDYVVSKELPISATDTTSSVSDANTLKDLWLTNAPNENQYYKNEERVLISRTLSNEASERQGGVKTWDFFTSDKSSSVVVASNYINNDELNLNENLLNITIGKTIS